MHTSHRIQPKEIRILLPNSRHVFSDDTGCDNCLFSANFPKKKKKRNNLVRFIESDIKHDVGCV